MLDVTAFWNSKRVKIFLHFIMNQVSFSFKLKIDFWCKDPALDVLALDREPNPIFSPPIDNKGAILLKFSKDVMVFAWTIIDFSPERPPSYSLSKGGIHFEAYGGSNHPLNFLELPARR
jgi:hypothetical protein